MPGLVRTRSSLEADDENDNLSSAPSENGIPGPSNSNKRPRLSDERASTQDPEDSWMLSPPGTVRAAQRPHRPANASRASSSLHDRRSREPRMAMPTFKPGQLVRVFLRNFVTYTSATFLPGPTLNMIIGPNGTGKSSVVCAICIGLDFGTAPLGRAKELSEFVKHGCSEATVEIELKGAQGQVNQVIRLEIEKEGSKKKWHINNRPCNAKDVKKITRTFGIQIDNLCHFLPQDRVVEFSRLSPKDRLSSTLRGAAPDHITEQHEQLRELASKQKEDLKKQGDTRKVLKNLEDRQNGVRGDVERMRERGIIQERVRMLELTRPVARLMQADYEVKGADKQVQDLDRDISALRDSLEPGQVAVKAKQNYVKEVDRVKGARKKLCDLFEKKVKDCSNGVSATDTQLKTNDGDKARAESDIKDEERKMKGYQQKIDNFKCEAEQEPVDFDPAAFNERKREKTRQQRECDEHMEESRISNGQYVETMNMRKSDIGKAKNQLANLATEAGKQGRVLEKASKDAKSAWDWIENHRELLKGEVYAPPILSCSVKDKAYAAMIESMFQANDLIRITCTDNDDWKMLQHEFTKNQKLTNITLIHSTMSLQNFKKPVSEEVERRFDVKGWALDYISGPERVLAWCCENLRMNSTAVIMDEMNNQQFEMLQASGLTNCISPRQRYIMTSRPEYGPDAKSTQVRPVKSEATIWGAQAFDTSAEANIEAEIVNWGAEVDDLQKKLGNGREHVGKMRQRIEELTREAEEIEAEKNEIQTRNNRLASIPIKISNEEGRLDEAKAKETEAREKLETCRRQRQQILLKRAQLAIDFTSAVENLRTMHMQHIIASIASIEARSDVESLEQQHADSTSELQAKEAAKEEKRQAWRKARDVYRKAAADWQKNRGSESKLHDYWNSITEEERTRNPEDLETEIESQHARIGMLHGGDARVITEYEDRERRIERHRGDMASMNERVINLENEIKEIREVWEPELEALVAKISDAFATSFNKINCLGSVEIGKSVDSFNADNDVHDGNDNEAEANAQAPAITGHDFENWTIEIRVSFREGEQLSVLDSHRQSGGERAVTTIYYLMALQSLSRAPFRVVDEINQGMDPRNERIVHERMVDIACGSSASAEDGDEDTDGGSQYFLITPKLLPGLKYDGRMKVHVIASGEFMPKAEGEHGGQSMDFAKCVEKMKMLKAAA